MRKLHLFMFLIGICGTLVAQSSDVPEVLAPAIDGYLQGVHTSAHPLGGHGSTFVTEGARYQVNPRFLVAISGGETTFGVHVCGQNNAFNWFWNGSCPVSPFDSWDSGIHTVAHYMQKSYILHGYTTIPTISKKYCTSGCTNWIPLVGKFYSDLGGDPNAPVIWNAAAPAQTPTTTVPEPAPVATPVPPTAVPAAPNQATLTAKLTTVTRSGFPLSSNRTVSLTVLATAENLGTMKPATVSLSLDGASGSQVVASMTPVAPSSDGQTVQYSGTVVLTEKQLEGETVSVAMALSNVSSKKVSKTLHASGLAVPSSSNMVLFIVLGAVLALLLVGGTVFAVVRARGNRTKVAAPTTPAVTK